MTYASKILSPLFFLAFLFSACHTAQKYVESGDYDSAIDFTVNKLRGKAKKREEDVKALELAFQKAQSRDMGSANILISEARTDNWERINDLHRAIRDRQNKVSPLTPLTASNGYKAHFEFFDIATLERQSREKAAEYIYNDAVNTLNLAEKGDKMAARRAYQRLQYLQSKYYPSYRDKDALMRKARDLGTSYVVLEVVNQSGKNLPKDFAERILAMNKQDLNSEWEDFSFEEQPGLYYDYRAVYKIRDIDVSPEREQERVYTDEKKIKEGWDYVLDSRGNVKKDSLGNDIKVTRYAMVRADILELHQTKAARISGSMEVRDHQNNSLLETCELGTEVVFENFAYTFRGDERALSEDSKRKMGSHPLPFPKDRDMLIQAADRLKPEVQDELRRSRAIL